MISLAVAILCTIVVVLCVVVAHNTGRIRALESNVEILITDAQE